MLSLHFLRPSFFLLLPLLLWLIYTLQMNTHRALWQTIVSPELLGALLEQKTTPQRSVIKWGLSILACLLVLALAGPSWQKKAVTVYQTQDPLVIALDVSDNMRAEDVTPTRMARAQYKIHDLLAAHRNSQIGLIAFTQHAFVVSPITQDGHTLEALLQSLSPDIMPVAGHHFGNALQKSRALLQQAGFTQGRIILVTASTASDNDIAMARQLKRQGYTVSVLGIGTREGAPIPINGAMQHDSSGKIIMSQLHPLSLTQLAQAGGGAYHRYSIDDEDIRKLVPPLSSKAVAGQEKLSLWQDEGYLLLWVMLPFLSLLFRRGWLDEVVQR